MALDKHTEQYSTKNMAAREILAQILCDASSDDEILAKREETSMSLVSQEDQFLYPIGKKLKLEGGLQEFYGLKTETFVPRVNYSHVPPVKQEEATDLNFKLEDSHSQIGAQEHSEKVESNQCHSGEELARQIKKQAKKEKISMTKKNYYQNNKESILESSKNYYHNNKGKKAAEIRENYYKDNKELFAENSRNWQKINEENNAERRRIYYKENKERSNESARNYQQNNKEKCIECVRNFPKKNVEKSAEKAEIYLWNFKEWYIRCADNCKWNKGEYQKFWYQKSKEKNNERVRNWTRNRKDNRVPQPQVANPSQSNSVKPQLRPEIHHQSEFRSSHSPLTLKPTPEKNLANTIQKSTNQSTGPEDSFKLGQTLSSAPTLRQEEPHDFTILSKKEPTQEECRIEVKQEECRSEVKQEEC